MIGMGLSMIQFLLIDMRNIKSLLTANVSAALVCGSVFEDPNPIKYSEQLCLSFLRGN